MLGTVADAQGDRAAARGFYEKALQVQPDFIAAHMSLAQLDIQEGKLSEAGDRYDALLKRDKNSIPVLLALANLQARQNKTDDARKVQEVLDNEKRRDIVIQRQCRPHIMMLTV